MTRVLAALLFLSAMPLPAQATDAQWNKIRFLFGKWVASGAGQPGAGQGEYSFEPELNNQIVVRRNVAKYTTGAQHDDLMIIYAGTRAIYFDSEGHTIHYAVATPAPNSVVFESEPSQPGPRYRLTYLLEGKSLIGKFEMMDPGKTEYKTYLTWSSVNR